MPVSKVPPPPPVQGNPAFNRWLLTLTAFVNAKGTIPADNIDTADLSNALDIPALSSEISSAQAAINALTPQINSLNQAVGSIAAQLIGLNNTVSGNAGDISTLQSDVASLQAAVSTINGEIAALQANPIVRNGSGAPANGLGNVNDWYADTAGSAIYVKTGASTWTLV